MFRRTKKEESWRWRHEVELPAPTARFTPAEERLDSAWRQLVFVHTSFRATEQREYRDLVDALRGIERLFFDHPELGAYYDEWVSMRTPQGAPPVGTEPAADARIRHVAAMQAQFMEDVYFVLQLARFANALDNRGWMNLFRAWGRSATFNRVFTRLRPTFAQEFVEFYDNYVRDYPGTIEDYPVPHPWDSATLRADPRYQPAAAAGAPMAPDVAPAAAATVPVTLPGVFLDSGVQEVGRRSGRLRAPAASPGGGTRGLTEDPNLAAAVEQQQAPADPRGAPTKMPPNA